MRSPSSHRTWKQRSSTGRAKQSPGDSARSTRRVVIPRGEETQQVINRSVAANSIGRSISLSKGLRASQGGPPPKGVREGTKGRWIGPRRGKLGVTSTGLCVCVHPSFSPPNPQPQKTNILTLLHLDVLNQLLLLAMSELLRLPLHLHHLHHLIWVGIASLPDVVGLLLHHVAPLSNIGLHPAVCLLHRLLGMTPLLHLLHLLRVMLLQLLLLLLELLLLRELLLLLLRRHATIPGVDNIITPRGVDVIPQITSPALLLQAVVKLHHLQFLLLLGR